MKKRSIFTTIALLFICLMTNAQSQISSEQLQSQFRKDTLSIERKCTQILNEAFSDAEMGNAVSDLEKDYETLMTKYYNLLLSNIKEEDKNLIIQNQNDWIKYKKSEMELYNKVYWEYDGFGSMGRLSVISNSQELVKARTIQLYRYLYTLLEY